MEEKKKVENKFKQVWANRRNRAMIQLAGYILFFILIGAIIDFERANISYLEGTNSSQKTISFSFYDNYEFYYNITYLGIVDEPVKYMNIDGYRYKQKQVFQVRDTLEKYYFEDHKLYQIKNTLVEIPTPFSLSLERLSPSMLYTYIKKAKQNSKTEYADKLIKKEYILSVHDFARLYQNEEIDIKGNIYIITYEKDKMINKVELDLTAYNKMKYELNYKNIGKVKSFYKEDFLPISNDN